MCDSSQILLRIGMGPQPSSALNDKRIPYSEDEALHKESQNTSISMNMKDIGIRATAQHTSHKKQVFYACSC